MKKIFLQKIFIYIIIYIILIIEIQAKDYDFLENKTLDHLRQIFWSGRIKITNFDNDNAIYESIWNETDIQKIKQILKNFFKEQNISDNAFFEVKETDQITDLIEKNETDLPINYLINFAFNIDKYDRTQKEEINSVSDYITYFTRDRIKKFIYEKLAIYTELNDPKNFTKIVLNNILFNYKDTKSYLARKSKKELIQLIYGFERYCFNSNKSIEEDCTLAYNLCSHENFESYSLNDLDIKLSTYYKRTNLDKDVNKFIDKIENRDFKYPNIKKFISQFIDEDQLNNNLIALETYYKRQTNTENSLSKLYEYIQEMPKERKKEILQWGIDLFPELGIKGALEDISSSKRNLQFGNVKQFVKATDREVLLKYAYNIHTFHNNITSIYDDDLFDFIRMNENLLYDKILKDANKNKLLQDSNNFTYYASLYQDSIEEYLNKLQRNQLKIFTAGLIQLYYDKQILSGNNDIKFPSERRELIDSIEKLNRDELIEIAKNISKKIAFNKIEDLFNLDNQDKENNYIIKYFDFYENIMDFFRSTDISYLRMWLRKYEIIIRNLKSKRFLSGGLKTNYLNINEFSSSEILNSFDIYVYEYPDLFTPEKFIKIVGLNTGKTPHKFLVENAKNNTIIQKVTSSIIEHFERKNIQTNFNTEGFLSIIKTKDFDEEDNIIIKDRYLYQLFRLINIFPELNNWALFKIMCVDDNTRIISSNELKKETFEKIYKENPVQFSEMINNINHYYKIRKIEKTKSANDLEFINQFYYRDDIISDDTTKLRILYGDFYPVVYDFCISINNLNDIIIDNICNILEKEGKIENTTDLLSTEEKKEIIINASSKFEELQNPTFFDAHYNYINFSSEYPNTSDKLFVHLSKTNIKNIFYYCLTANILKISRKNMYNDNNDGNLKIPGDIYLNIRYMSRVSMIRYILDVAKYFEKLGTDITPEYLQKFVKYYMLDIGNDNINNLTLY